MSSSNQISHQVSDQVVSISPEASANTVGAILRAAREKAGLTSDELARRLCMTPDKLEALEQDAFERFAGVTYVRGYIRNLCKELGLDNAAVMEAFVQQVPAEASKVFDRAPVGTVMASRGEKQGGSLFMPMVLMLAVAAAGGYWWMDQQSGGASQLVRIDTQGADTSELQGATSSYGAQADTAEADVSLAASDAASLEAGDAGSVLTGEDAGLNDALETDAEIAETGDLVAGYGDDLGEGSGADSSVASAAVAVTEETPVEEQVAAPSVAAPAAAVQARPAQPETQPQGQSAGNPTASAVAAPQLVISFDEESWLEVSDATGYKMISKLQPAGSRVELDGRGPFSLMLGNAAAATVTFNGEVVDSAPQGNRRTRKLSVGG
ncbi:RodZ domain-containing protein [Microbulbifer pacificus]|uniref:DUF4115 domain-containing protein n=1 Tax=Microbulbifer pacificus TaxID=407164 RepID=A0AAU0N1Q7_9GAMM|nr:RodZ domain-containing protein [Microbulbifer pacificus]WOX06407.1 DUF4115 domain-containing protein [Microbulbifer pacificus]